MSWSIRSAFAFACLSACVPDGLPIVSIDVVDRSTTPPDPKLRLDARVVREMVKARAAKLGGFAVRDARAGERRHQLSALLAFSFEGAPRPGDAGLIPKDQVYRGIAIDLALAELDPGDEGLRARHEARITYGRNAPLFEPIDAILDEALGRGFEVLAASIALRSAPPAKVNEAIAGSDPEIAARAIEVAAARSMKSTIPAIIRLIEDETAPPPLRVRSIGALVELGDQSAVGPLIAFAKGRSPAFLVQIIFGVAQIGGKEAEAWLFTVSSGHPDATIRQSAREALAELEARKQRGKKASDQPPP